MPRKLVKCNICGRTFNLPLHLGRHMATIHGSSARKATKKAKKRMGKIGRPMGAASKFGLRGMGIEQLKSLIDAARQEARLRLAEIERSL